MKSFRILPFCLVSAILAGCSAAQSGSNGIKSVMVEPAPDAGFIEHPERQSKPADLPFQKVWIKPGSSLSAYQSLVVAPVNTYYMQEMDWLHKMSSVNVISDVKKDIEELAYYFHDQVVKKFKDDPQHRFQIVEYPGQQKGRVVRLELALIEIDPSQPVLHALSWAGPPGTGTAAGLINQRRAAFEGRLRDLQTGEVIATFADRDTADAGPLDLTRLTWYGPAKGIMDRWAEQFVQIANRRPGEAVEDPIPFTLRPF
ncbi:DUF3313 family protein [Methylomicrobium sp. RS1]|jgi:hypothetical protein|uniref:DUF3313 family protein n=1 Tax=Candidatus Methylomicrobium oryzae TaxID=2802053 RepID=UPI001923EE96|nr:DUF3313 family protein [Methylomicrobium sp. RS1]MBL1265223.1 DUF3313 family protein [Methylomicrobium sp. RS1]